MKTAMITALIGASLCISVAAQAHPGRGGKPPAMALMHTLRDMSLTDTQKQQIRPLLADAAATRMLNARPDPGERMASLMAMSEEALNAEVRERFDARQDKAFEMASLRHDIYLLLNDTQRQQLATSPGRRSPSANNKRQRALPFPADELTLSESQQATLSALRQQQHVIDSEFASVMANLRAAEQALVYSDAFSYERWLAEREPFRATLLDLALSRASNRYAMVNVLTEQQQQLMLTIMATKSPKKPPRHGRG